MSNSNRNKNQHLVPNWYLKRWAKKSRYNPNQYDIFYYDKEKDIIKKTSTDSDKITEKHFYTMPEYQMFKIYLWRGRSI